MLSEGIYHGALSARVLSACKIACACGAASVSVVSLVSFDGGSFHLVIMCR